MCFGTELGPRSERRQPTETQREYAWMTGSRSAPIGTPNI
jgi:hypothetical protein